MKIVLVLCVIALFISVSVLSGVSSANDISVSTETTGGNDDSRDWGFGFILCTVEHVDWFEREIWMAWNVTFELTDYDTGEVIEEKTCLLGIHLFKFLPRGHNYMINVSTSKGWETVGIANMGFFRYIPIYILIFDY